MTTSDWKALLTDLRDLLDSVAHVPGFNIDLLIGKIDTALAQPSLKEQTPLGEAAASLIVLWENGFRIQQESIDELRRALEAEQAAKPLAGQWPEPITDRPPTEADGDDDPWRHTPRWQPPAAAAQRAGGVMDLSNAIDVIESVSGFTDVDTPVGEAWAVVLAQLKPAPVPVASNTRYEFSVLDGDYTEQAGGTAPSYAQALSEGQRYLAQYQQDGPHTLEVRRVENLNPGAFPVPDGELVELVAWLRNMSEAGLGGLDELNAGRAADLLRQLSTAHPERLQQHVLTTKP